MIIHFVTTQAVQMVACCLDWGRMQWKSELTHADSPPIPVAVLTFHPNANLVPGCAPKIHQIPAFVEVLN